MGQDHHDHLVRKLNSDKPISKLTSEDVNCIHEQAIHVRSLKKFFCKALLSGLTCCRKKDMEERLQEMALERFEENLDIRSFLNVHTNLALLISILLTDK